MNKNCHKCMTAVPLKTESICQYFLSEFLVEHNAYFQRCKRDEFQAHTVCVTVDLNLIIIA